MFIVSGPSILSLVFINKNDLKSVLNILNKYVEDTNISEDELLVYTQAHEGISPEKVKNATMYLKYVFEQPYKSKEGIAKDSNDY